jgi:peptide/nickel transport system ATP-binding protein
MSEQIMVMRNGSIEERGPAVQVLHQPRSAYTQKLLESIPGLA